MARKMVQITVTPKGTLFALCDDGTLWYMQDAEDDDLASSWGWIDGPCGIELKTLAEKDEEECKK